LVHYGDQLKNGRDPADIIADLAYSDQGQEFITPAEQAAINAQNLGFGASLTTGGNGADDAAMVAAHQATLDAASAQRIADGTQYVNNDKGDLMNVFTGVSNYLERFATEMTKVLDNGLVGKIADTLEGEQTSNALVAATGAPKEDINLAMEILSKGNEVVQAGFKLTPLGQVVSSLIASSASGGLVSSSTTDSSYTTGNNDNSVTVTPLNNSTVVSSGSIVPNSGRFD